MRYDFAISCQSAVSPDGDELGAHAFHALNVLGKAGLRCVAFTGSPPAPGVIAALPLSVELVHVRTDKAPLAGNMGGAALNFTRDLCLALCDFLRDHQIHVLEFPDRRAEGYFFIQHNRVHRLVPTVAVRIHGPGFILDEDNARRHCTEQDALLCAAELESIEAADRIVHSDAALLDRVLACFGHARARELSRRCARIALPLCSPAADAQAARSDGTRRALVCPATLDYRSGADLFVRNAARHAALHPEQDLRFVLVGEDTRTPDGGSFRDYLRALVPPEHQPRFLFETSPSPAVRRRALSDAGAFILPCRATFAPASLVEVLGHGKPTAISRHGIARGSDFDAPGTLLFSPENTGEWDLLFAELGRDCLVPRRETPTGATVDFIKFYRDAPGEFHEPTVNAKLSLVIAHRDHAEHLESLLARLRASNAAERLEVLVVDDGSTPTTKSRLSELAASNPQVRWLKTQTAGAGPFRARWTGTEAATHDFVAYVDADDHIDVDLYLRYARALASDHNLDVILPSMRSFGEESHHWIPLPKARFTVFFTGFAHVGLIGRKSSLLRAFAHAEPATRDILHGEDCIFSLSLFFGGARIAGLLEIAYHYNRTNPRSRSQTNDHGVWHSRHSREAHFDRCMAEALEAGLVTPLDMRLIRQIALALPPEHSAINIHRRGSRVAWHTHLYRAWLSLLGDPRYRA